MEKVFAIGTVTKNWTKTTRESGAIEYSIPVLVKEAFRKADGEIDYLNSLIVNKVWKKAENMPEFETNLKEGACVFTEGDMLKSAYGINEKSNNVYGLFTCDNVRQFLFVGKNAENFIKLVAVGNVCSDAKLNELKNNPDRMAINFSIACNERKGKDQDGNPIEDVVFINCGMFREKGKTGISDYLKQGIKVIVEGRPVVRTGTKQDGTPTSYFNAEIYNVEFAGKSAGNTQTPQPEFENPNLVPQGGFPNDDLPF